MGKKSKRRLSEVFDLWFHLHGQNLSSARVVQRFLDSLVIDLGDPWAHKFTATDWINYRQRKIAAGCSPSSIKTWHQHVMAVFNELSRLGHWDRPNPMATVRHIKFQQTEKRYLTVPQISALLARLKSAHTDAYRISLVCLSTGSRWSEAESLHADHVQPNLIHFTKTKSRKFRAVPISDRLYRAIDPVGHGRLFSHCRGEFHKVYSAMGFDTPGQSTHVLRHTFASHFMMNGGNILTLQKVLGHASLELTLRYAHLAPDYLKETIDLNPLSHSNLIEFPF